MNLTTFLLFGLMSLVIGAVLMILLQYYFFIKYGNLPEESMEQRDINERYSLPDVSESITILEMDCYQSRSIFTEYTKQHKINGNGE